MKSLCLNQQTVQRSNKSELSVSTVIVDVAQTAFQRVKGCASSPLLTNHNRRSSFGGTTSSCDFPPLPPTSPISPGFTPVHSLKSASASGVFFLPSSSSFLSGVILSNACSIKHPVHSQTGARGLCTWLISDTCPCARSLLLPSKTELMPLMPLLNMAVGDEYSDSLNTIENEVCYTQALT